MKIPLIKRIDLPPERRVNVDLEGVVVGKIVAISTHPNAAIIRIARVAIGKNKYIKIIFGGPKIEYIGALVAVALLGTLTDDGKMKKRRYRGKISKGMICSAVELGIVKRGLDEIMILPHDMEVGTPLKLVNYEVE